MLVASGKALVGGVSRRAREAGLPRASQRALPLDESAAVIAGFTALVISFAEHYFAEHYFAEHYFAVHYCAVVEEGGTDASVLGCMCWNCLRKSLSVVKISSVFSSIDFS